MITLISEPSIILAIILNHLIYIKLAIATNMTKYAIDDHISRQEKFDFLSFIFCLNC